jgi:single-strand DNA-binding protein
VVNDSQLTVIGNVVGDLRFMVTDSGVPLANFRIVNRPRRFDRASATWIDGEPNFYIVNCWRTLAENVGSSVGKGDPVVVTGRLRLRTWQKDENHRVVNAEIDAVSVGHDLRWGTTAFHRVRRQEAVHPERDTATTEPAQAPAQVSAEAPTQAPTAAAAETAIETPAETPRSPTPEPGKDDRAA